MVVEDWDKLEREYLVSNECAMQMEEDWLRSHSYDHKSDTRIHIFRGIKGCIGRKHYLHDLSTLSSWKRENSNTKL